MNHLLKPLLFLSVFALSSTAFAADFQLKGLTLGLEEKATCGQSTITSLQDSLNETGVTGIEFPATGCELIFDTVAGIKPAGPARLFFWKGRLVRFLVDFESLPLSEAASLRATFMDMYGKPSTKRSAPFRTDTWRTSKQSLELEWTDRIPADVGAYMTDTVGWAEYQGVAAKAVKALDVIKKKRQSNDLRN
jgi:hypothetical protein